MQVSGRCRGTHRHPCALLYVTAANSQQTGVGGWDGNACSTGRYQHCWEEHAGPPCASPAGTARVLPTYVPPGYCLLMYRPVASTTNAPTSLMYRPGNNAPTSLMYCPVASKFLLFSSRISSSRSASCSSNKPATASLQLLKPTQGRGYTRAQQRGAASAAHWEGVCFVVARGVMFMHSLGAPGTHLIDYRY